MKARLALILLLLLLATNPSSGHRMMMGYQVNEIHVTALYDDGTPAQGAEIEVQSDGKTIEKGVTDDRGAYIVRPGKGSGDLTFVSYSTGHRAELNLDLAQKGRKSRSQGLSERQLALAICWERQGWP